jgi:8-oxo-dGTP diphosphatase
VPLLLVRHAKAGSRRSWDGDDRFRPLSDEGRRQAEGLVRLLTDFGPARVLSSPYVRCVQTVEPLAAMFGLAVEQEPALAEGRCGKAARLIQELVGGGTVVLCTHGDIIPEVLRRAYEVDGVDLGDDPRCAKGSTWILEYGGGRCLTAQYLDPPT